MKQLPVPEMPLNGPAMGFLVPASPGQVWDRISILQIKTAEAVSRGIESGVRRELDYLVKIWEGNAVSNKALSDFEKELGRVNQLLWECEDKLREFEQSKDFGPEFIDTARSVYKLNDIRANLKARIDEVCGSDLTEQKLYSCSK